MIAELVRDIAGFWKKKQFAAGVVLTLVIAYLTQLLQPTVGIDDTAFKLYFIDGVAPAAGRWVLYLVQRILPLDYNPYFMEAAGLLCFALSVTLWCVLFQKILGNRVPDAAYTLFACIMAANPIHAELVVWYLQNGIFIGYGMTALALIFCLDSLRERTEGDKAGREFGGGILPLGIGVLCLWGALGLYESFMTVFLVGWSLCFLSVCRWGNGRYRASCGAWLIRAVLCASGSIVLRTVMLRFLYRVRHLESQRLLETRGISEVLGWFDQSRSAEDLVLVLKNFFLKYYLHAAVYFPILLFAAASALILGWSLLQAFWRKKPGIALGAAGAVLAPWIMPLLEGNATFYRAAQFVPVLTAFAIFPAAGLAGKKNARKQRRGIGLALGVCAALLLYRECYDMNYWLYLESLKYRDTVRTMERIAEEIRENCDAAKPVCVVGEYRVPEAIAEKAAVPYWSKKYKILTWAAGEDLLWQNRYPYGYCAAETPLLSTISWGVTAFHTYDRELIKFWRMHGYSFTEDLSPAHNEEARELMKELPSWPMQGAVTEREEYILVNLGDGEQRADEE